MHERFPLLVAVTVSLLLHVAVIGLGELLTGGDSPPPSRDAFQVEYPPPEPPGQKVEKKKAPEPPAGKSISLETPDPVYRPYFTALTRAIENFWTEPVRDRKDPSQGSVVITFTLGADGELKAVSVERSSGVQGMDLAAVRAVKKAAPFPEIPSEIATGELTVTALFVYD